MGRMKLCCCMAAALGLLFSVAAAAEWLDSYPTALQLAAQRNQPVFIYFRTASVVACQDFETQVLAQPAIGSALSGFVPVYLDPTRNETLAEKLGVYRVPAIVLVSAEGAVLYSEQTDLSADRLLPALLQHGVAAQVRSEVSPQATPPAIEAAVSPEVEESSGIITMPVPEAARLEPIRIRARAVGLDDLRLRYRMQGEKNYLVSPMRRSSRQEWWEGEIPGWIVTPKGVEYYLSGRREGQTVTVPANAQRRPFRVKVH